MKIGCYARVSTQDQQTLALQRDAMAAYAQQRGWSIVATITEVGSGVRERQQRDQLMRAARRREIDAIVVWRLDRWGRSVVDLVNTLHELQELGVGFISLHEALDLVSIRAVRIETQQQTGWYFSRSRKISCSCLFRIKRIKDKNSFATKGYWFF